MLPINQILLGDCLEVMRSLPDASIDAIVSDPPYPEISRNYGRMSEDAWMAMMIEIVKESRRVLKPTGSAVFILQPNSRKVGSMRLWLWEFMVWCGRNWNIVQDVYWWNYTAPPTVHAHAVRGLTKPSLKNCIWVGEPNCYRNQDEVLWTPSDSMKAAKMGDRALKRYPSGLTMRKGRVAERIKERGGCTPFNVLPLANSSSTTSSGAHGHGADTKKPTLNG